MTGNNDDMAAGTFELFLSLRGRVPRSTYWLWSVPIWGGFLLLFVSLEALFGRTSTLLLYPLFFWALLMLAVKRYHDIGKSPLWLLLLFIPLLGPLWVGLELGFRKGTDGENHYGDDPLQGADYFTVP